MLNLVSTCYFKHHLYTCIVSSNTKGSNFSLNVKTYKYFSHGLKKILKKGGKSLQWSVLSTCNVLKTVCIFHCVKRFENQVLELPPIQSLDCHVLKCLPSTLFQISHTAVSALCRSIKLQCELYSSRQIAICLDPYCGLGFVLWCLAR